MRSSSIWLPLPHQRRTVLTVVYLVFTEGYASTSGDELIRVEPTDEAIRLARILHRCLPGEHEVTGLLALILLTDARRPARTDADGLPVSLEDQDRRRWDTGKIYEGRSLVTHALAARTVGSTRCSQRSPRCTTRRRT